MTKSKLFYYYTIRRRNGNNAVRTLDWLLHGEPFTQLIGKHVHSDQITYLNPISSISITTSRWRTHRDKNVRDFFLILLPGFAILSPASHNISPCSMNDHDHEENEIKPRKEAPTSRQSATNRIFHNSAYSRWTYSKPVISPQDMEKNISGT